MLEPWIWATDPYLLRCERVAFCGAGPSNGYLVKTGLEPARTIGDRTDDFMGAAFERLWSAVNFRRGMEMMATAKKKEAS